MGGGRGAKKGADVARGRKEGGEGGAKKGADAERGPKEGADEARASKREHGGALTTMEWWCKRADGGAR